MGHKESNQTNKQIHVKAIVGLRDLRVLGKFIEVVLRLDPYEIYQILIYRSSNYIQKNTLFLEHVVLEINKILSFESWALTTAPGRVFGCSKWNIFILWRKKIIQKLGLTSSSVVIGVAPITQLRTCVIKIVTFKGDHLMW